MSQDTKKITAEVTISRTSNDVIKMTIHDETSGEQFVEVNFTYEQFAKCITNLHQTDIPCIVKGLDKVGKKKIVERRHVIYPGSSYDSKEKMSQWLFDNCQEEGYYISTYLGSQRCIFSVTTQEDQTWLNYTINKYE
jgi:hypothetical protein